MKITWHEYAVLAVQESYHRHVSGVRISTDVSLCKNRATHM
jgi:hypothetical protein